MGVLELLLVAGVAVASPNYVAHFRRDLPPNVTPPSSAGFQNATFHPSRGGGAVCVSGFVPVTASARNLRFKNFRIPQNQTDATDTFLKYFSAGSTYPQDIMAGMQTASGTYSIGATFCSPGTSNSTNSSSTVELLTHGIGFDRHYWDFAPDYSYVDVAAKNGHSTFFYDRLSVGLSSKEDPLNTVQAALQVEIANVLATSLRNGTYSNTKFSKVIGVGHSFGSIITEAVTSKYPTSLSAAILTGFSVNSTGTPPFLLALNLAIAAINQPIRFANLNPGYLVDDTVISAQTGFFRAPNFDPQILAAAENTKGTTTYGELFSITAVLAPANNFTGPVAVINGANDLPFCFGNCSYPTDLAAAVKPALYSNLPASKFTSYLAPSTGHGVNFHYTATAAFNFIETFLKQQGI